MTVGRSRLSRLSVRVRRRDLLRYHAAARRRGVRLGEFVRAVLDDATTALLVPLRPNGRHEERGSHA